MLQVLCFSVNASSKLDGKLMKIAAVVFQAISSIHVKNEISIIAIIL